MDRKTSHEQLGPAVDFVGEGAGHLGPTGGRLDAGPTTYVGRIEGGRDGPDSHQVFDASGRGRARVMFVTCHLPYPSISGGRLREYELLRRLSDTCDVAVRVVSRTYEDDLASAARLHEFCESVEVYPADGRVTQAANPSQTGLHASQGLTRAIGRDLQSGRWDVVHVEGFYLMQHIPRDVSVPVVLVEQNVEYLLWRQRTVNARDARERRSNLKQYLLTLESEIEAWRRADLCAAVTKDDQVRMLATGAVSHVEVVPDGCDHLAEGYKGLHGDERTIVYVANFAYEPNRDAARYMCEDILPLVRTAVPEARLVLVGNAPDDSLRELAERCGVVVTGRVPEVGFYLERAAVFVCPLRVGGGVKVKVLEALHLGKAIVTTSVGAQGIPGLERAAIVTDDPQRFAEGVVRILRDPELRRALEKRSLGLAARLPTWDEAAAALVDCYRKVAPVAFGRHAPDAGTGAFR